MIALRKPPFYVVAEPAVQRIGELAGKRIGVDRIGSLQHLVVRLLMRAKGADPSVCARRRNLGWLLSPGRPIGATCPPP